MFSCPFKFNPLLTRSLMVALCNHTFFFHYGDFHTIISIGRRLQPLGKVFSEMQQDSKTVISLMVAICDHSGIEIAWNFWIFISTVMKRYKILCILQPEHFYSCRSDMARYETKTLKISTVIVIVNVPRLLLSIDDGCCLLQLHLSSPSQSLSSTIWSIFVFSFPQW